MRLFLPLRAAATLSACAELPICPPIRIDAYETEDGLIFVMDANAFAATIERQRALESGRCKLPPHIPAGGAGV